MPRSSYKSYSYDFKVAAIATGLKAIKGTKIPRFTVHHWKTHGIRAPQESKSEAVSKKDGVEELKADLELQRAVSATLGKVLGDFLRGARVVAPRVVAEALDKLRTCYKEAGAGYLDDFLATDICKKVAEPICDKSIDGGCLKRQPNRLAEREIKAMKTLVTSRKY